MHVPRWIIRAALVSIAALLFGHPWMVLGLWGLFSAVFRFALNRWRGLDWRYIAPWSNTYDLVFYGLAGEGWPHKGLRMDPVSRAYHNGFKYDGIIMWGVRDRVHRAGTLAYAVEVVAFVVVAYICG
jgi:hypothetical protein